MILHFTKTLGLYSKSVWRSASGLWQAILSSPLIGRIWQNRYIKVIQMSENKEILLAQQAMNHFFQNEEIESSHTIAWLDKHLKNSENVFPSVTHVAKLTHSSSKAISVRDSIVQSDYLHLITTQTANIDTFDASYTNSVYQPLARFLNYPINGSEKRLGEVLSNNELCFSKISNNKEQRETWCNQIKLAYQHQPKSYVLAKQIYLPVSDDYHLVSPMYSSSLVDKIYHSVKDNHSSENEAKQAKEDGKYNENTVIHYPDIAVLRVTGGNKMSDIIKAAMNVSLLNKERLGEMYLFCAKPPKIRHNPNPPKSVNELLNVCYSDCKDELFEIKKLLSITENKALFLNDDRKNALIEHIQNIGDTIITQMLVIYQNQANGWTDNVNLPAYLKLFLDKAISEQWILSQPELMSELTQLAEEISAWISTQTHKNRVAKLEKIYAKILLPLLQSHYWVLKA